MGYESKLANKNITKHPGNNSVLLRNLEEMHYLDRLSIHLVAADKKPSALLSLRRSDKANRITEELKGNGLNLIHFESSQANFFDVALSRDLFTCAMLVRHVQNDDKYNVGITLGYPKNTVNSFINKFPGSIWSHQQMIDILSNRIMEGKKIPTFFAYLLHVPEAIIDQNGVIYPDTPSKEHALVYYRHIRNSSSALSNEIEREFGIKLAKQSQNNDIISNGMFYYVR